MIISHKWKFIFIKTAKTAGTSLEVYLSQFCGPDDVLTPFAHPEQGHQPQKHRGRFNPLPEIWHALRCGNHAFKREELKKTCLTFGAGVKFYHHLPAWKIERRVPGNVWDNYYKFCVERNPWDKVNSGYNYFLNQTNEPVTFDEYLNRLERCAKNNYSGVGLYPYNYSNYTDPCTDKVLVDHILPYEHLDQELSVVLPSLGLPACSSLPTHRKSGLSKNNTSGLTTERVRRIHEIFAREINLMGYTESDSRRLP